MSFTQNHPKKIDPKRLQAYVFSGDRCDGCDKLCKVSYRFSVMADYIYPTIDNEVICRYVDENNNIQYSGIPFNVHIVELQKKYAKELAGKIACLCDYYKTK